MDWNCLDQCSTSTSCLVYGCLKTFPPVRPAPKPDYPFAVHKTVMKGTISQASLIRALYSREYYAIKRRPNITGWG